jgi:CO/xanthine dehydrogenase Mo-binding subunit
VERRAGRDGKPQYQVLEEEQLAPWEQGTDFRVVGRSFPRLEGAEKVTGRARYAYDVRLPQQLYARVLRSPHPHARIRRIETGRAAALPGVHAVISSADAPDISWYQEGKLFETTVRFVGDEVAAVAAESEEVADDALRLIDVEYEPLPFVVSLEAALEPGAPRVHESGNRAGEPQVYERGDVGRLPRGGRHLGGDVRHPVGAAQ